MLDEATGKGPDKARIALYGAGAVLAFIVFLLLSGGGATIFQNESLTLKHEVLTERCGACHVPFRPQKMAGRCTVRKCHPGRESHYVHKKLDRAGCASCHREHSRKALKPALKNDWCLGCHEKVLTLKKHQSPLLEKPPPARGIRFSHYAHLAPEPERLFGLLGVEPLSCEGCHPPLPPNKKGRGAPHLEFPGHGACKACHEIDTRRKSKACLRCHELEVKSENYDEVFLAFNMKSKKFRADFASGYKNNYGFNHSSHSATPCRVCHEEMYFSEKRADKAAKKLLSCRACHETRKSRCSFCHKRY